jgi:hypothetical protein
MTAGGGPWGDESEVVRAAGDWAARRVVRPTQSKTTARPPEELAAAAGDTVTASGIGGEQALRVFSEILEPATRSQDDPMNLAYIPAAPTRAAVAFDLVTSAANVFAGTWEAGAGAIFAENQALGWMLRGGRNRRQPVRARHRAPPRAHATGRASRRRLATRMHGRRTLLDLGGRQSARRWDPRGSRG